MKKFKAWALENKKNIIKFVICFVGLVATTRYIGYVSKSTDLPVVGDENILFEIINDEEYDFKCYEGDIAFTGSYSDEITTLNYNEEKFYISEGLVYDEKGEIEEYINYVTPNDVYALTKKGKFESEINSEKTGEVYSISKEKYNHYFDYEIKKEDSLISLLYNDEDITVIVDDLTCVYKR